MKKAEGDLLGSTRTLLIQRGRWNTLNSSNLQPFTRARVTRCWSLLGFMLDLLTQCRSLLRVLQRLRPVASRGYEGGCPHAE